MPNHIIEHEMSDAETHLYEFDFNENELFQVQIEQKKGALISVCTIR